MDEAIGYKEIVSKILSIEDWSSFESFIFDLYRKNNEHIKIDKNYKKKAKSGRLREIDVFIKFGYKPHTISMGIECKYWTQKVDGDIVDIVKNKRDDLGIDKFAIITTKGYELGAKQYAESVGIDIFVIRPINDDDYGYSGRIIKFLFYVYGSIVENINVQSELICNANDIVKNKNYMLSRLNQMSYPKKNQEPDPEFNLYRIQLIQNTDNSMIVEKSELVGNLPELIDKERMKHTENFYNKKPFSLSHKIIFKKETAMILNKNIVAVVREVNFNIRYFLNVWKFEIDRGQNNPVVIENIIEKKITPLKKEKSNTEAFYKMCETYDVVPVDLLNKPPDVLGREGITGQMLLSCPMDLNKRNNDELYELQSCNNAFEWKKIY